MKNLYFIILVFAAAHSFAQSSGITYQAIIYNPSGEAIPGVNNASLPMANKNICLQFSILDATTQLEYQESVSTTTDEFGMVNLVIGNGSQTNGYATSFATISWGADQKSLNVALDINGQCSNFIEISNQKFEAVPYAFSAGTATSISGVLPIENGGTNATSVVGARTNLGLENVDNTSDLNKPISTATQAAINLKEDLANKSTATALGTSDVLYPTQNAVKTYVDASATAATAAIANEAAIRAAADATLTTNLATEVTNRTNADATLTTNLATEVTNRTNADAVLTTNLAAEVTNRTNADLLKEDLINKSTATSLGTSNVLYPTQNAVKTYVDVITATTALAINNEGVIRAAADSVLTSHLDIEETNRINADLLKENLANKSTATALGTSDVLYPTQNAVKTYVDASATAATAAVSNEAAIRAAADAVLTTNLAAEVTNRTNADATLTTNLAAEVTNRTNADAVLTTNLAAEVTNRTNADLLKENLANKSTATALGTSDVLYPTQNAVKTYVDASATAATAAVSNEAAIRAAADAVLTTNLAAEVTNRTNADATLTANLAAEVTNRTNADATLTANLAAEVTNRTNADLLKENLANKSTATALGTSDVLYPTQNAVKTYVDASATAATAAVSNEAAIRAAADATLTTNLAAEVTNRTNADATLTTNLAAEVTNRTNADLLKENLANKSTATALGTSDVLYPTQNAVKTYVDASATAATAAVSNEAAIRAAADATLTTNLAAEVTNRTNADATLTTNLGTEVTNRTNADLLKENLSNKSTATTLGTSDVLYPTQNAVKTYVDASAVSGSAAVTNEAAIRAAADAVLTTDLAAEVTNRTNADATLTTNLGAEVTNRTNADAVLTTNLATEVTNRTNADLLKENLSNKSTATTLGTSDVLYPTQNAVKTYVDASAVSGSAAVTNEAAIRAAADAVLTTDLAAEVTNRTNADATLTTNLGAEVTNRTNADATLTTNLATEVTNRTNADLLKEDLANKSTATTLGTSDVLYPTQNAVKTYVDTQVTNGTTPDATNAVKGKIQLAGDLSGSAATPVIANNAITTTKLADASVTDAKITAVSGSKVSGNIAGSAANVTGTVAIVNGGTGQTTLAGVKGTLGLSGTTVAIGASSGVTNQGAGAVGLGNGTGQTNQGSQSVAIGYVAGNANQGANSVAIGSNAAQGGQGTQSVAIGIAANSGANNATALGGFSNAGHTNATAIGYQAATSANNTIQLGADGVTIPGSTAITNVKTSGTITAGTVTYPNAHNSVAGQVLTTNASGVAAWASPSSSASALSGTVAVANGGTGTTTLTGYVKGNGTSAMTASANIPVADISGAAPLASPAFTGTPTAPTAAANTNTTQVATTAFVTSALSTAGLPSQSGNNGKFLTTNGTTASWASGVSGSGTLNYIPRFSSSSALANSSLSDDGTGLRIGNPNGTNGIYTGLSSYDNTRLMVSGGREYESIRMTFPGDPYNNELSFNWYGSAWRMRTERSSGEITDLSFWKTTGSGVTTEKMRIDGDGYVKATGFKTQNGTSSQFLKANGTVDNSTYLTTSALTSPALTGTPTAPTAAANTNTTQIATTAFVTSALTTAGLPSQSGNNGKFLTTNGTTASWAASPGVPYSGATGAVNLGNYNLTVYGVKVGVGSGPDPYFLQYSTVVGKDALVSNTYGWQNNAFGFEAMNQNTTGNGNNAFGLSALRSNTSGNNNVAVGHAALHSSVTGNMNTAIGASAAYHSLGSQVTSIGYESLMGQGTGTGNTALGWRAGAAVYGNNTFSTFLGNNATAQNGTTNATAIGNDAFVNTSNTIQLGNTSITNVKTSGTLTAGNVTYPNSHNSVNGQILTTNGSGVASWTNTIAIANGGTGATTSAAALINLGAAPLVSPNFTGTPTATTASTGTNNTQVATTAFVNSSISSANSSLAPIWSPSFNGTPTAPTAAANTNTTQIATTAFVTSALTTAGLPSQSGNNGKFLTTNGTTASWASSAGVPYSGATGAVNLGDYNLTVRGIKIGTSGTDNNALQNNMVIGRDALTNTTNGYHNIAMGNTALKLNVGGYSNIAIGNEAQYNNLWGWGNVSLGVATLNLNVVGNFNTAIGNSAGYFLTSSYNTAVGHNALNGQGGGGGNTGVGVNAGGVSWHQTTYNSTFLGYNATAQNGLDNVIVIGYNAYTNEHNTIQLGNGAIVKLKTSGTIWSNGTQLTSDRRLKTNIQPLQNSMDLIMKLNPVHYDKKSSIESTDYNKTENGFIAQELQKVLPFVVSEGTDPDKILSVDYNSIIPILTKGIQEQQLLIEAQQKQIDEMKLMLEKLINDKK